MYTLKSATTSTNMRKREEENESNCEALFLLVKDTLPDLYHCLPAAGPCSSSTESPALSIAVCYVLPKHQ